MASSQGWLGYGGVPNIKDDALVWTQGTCMVSRTCQPATISRRWQKTQTPQVRENDQRIAHCGSLGGKPWTWESRGCYPGHSACLGPAPIASVLGCTGAPQDTWEPKAPVL